MHGNDFEIRRKVVHVLFGILLTVLLYYNVLRFWMLLSLLIISLILSYISIQRPIILIDWLLLKFERPEHIKSFPARGAISIIFSATILSLLFEASVITINVLCASLMIWTFGDALSAIVGNLHGRIKHPFNSERFIEGTASGIVAGTLGAMLFVPLLPAFIAAFISILIESVELTLLRRPIDDNILVPIISAVILMILV
jgi:dolichol kinase